MDYEGDLPQGVHFHVILSSCLLFDNIEGDILAFDLADIDEAFDSPCWLTSQAPIHNKLLIHYEYI